jgi:hypothetical protein
MQSHKLRKNAYAPGHPNLAMCMSNIAIHMQSTGRPARAERLYKGALKILQKAVGSRHQLTAFTRANYADFLVNRNRRAEALPLARKAMADLRAALPAGHRYVKWAREVLKRLQMPAPSVKA